MSERHQLCGRDQQNAAIRFRQSPIMKRRRPQTSAFVFCAKLHNIKNLAEVCHQNLRKVILTGGTVLTLVEKILFTVFVFVSLYYTYRGVMRIIGHISSGQGKPDWSLL